MAENSKIEWTHHTFNPWLGCTKISPACDGCYAESWAKRAGYPELWQGSRRRTTPANWKQPIKWDAAAKACGKRARVFCASLADVFDNSIEVQWRSDLFGMIRQTPNLDWLLLTKRIGNAVSMIEELQEPEKNWWPLPNVWLGATVVTRGEFDRDVDKLRATGARILFMSMEPLIESMGDIDLTGIHWVIVGGESGSKSREMKAEWAEQIRYRCESYGSSFFFKQGSANNWAHFKDFDTFPPYLQVREWPDRTSRDSHG